MRLNYGKTFTLGLGFMVISIIWSIYNEPWIAHRSDKTWNRLGRRMPYIVLAAPIGAVLFALIPFHTGLLVLVFTALGMNLAMGFYRAPAVALMPDITPRPLRSQANGIINFMGGLGALIAFFVAAPLYRLNPRLPFLLAAGLALVIVPILWWRIKEPKTLAGEKETRDLPFLQAVKSVFKPERRSAL